MTALWTWSLQELEAMDQLKEKIRSEEEKKLLPVSQRMHKSPSTSSNGSRVAVPDEVARSLNWNPVVEMRRRVLLLLCHSRFWNYVEWSFQIYKKVPLWDGITIVNIATPMDPPWGPLAFWRLVGNNTIAFKEN